MEEEEEEEEEGDEGGDALFHVIGDIK